MPSCGSPRQVNNRFGRPMRDLLIVALAVLPLAGCSHSPTQPTTSAGIASPPSPATPGTPGITIWRAESTVVGVSATLNGCPIDDAVDQTRTVEWAIEEGSFNPQVSIQLFESAGVYDPQHPPDYMSDPRTPVYYGSRTGDQFAASAEQDGQSGCFVWHGDLTGTFSADGVTFDAVENVKYTHFGEDDMTIRRHWTGTRR